MKALTLRQPHCELIVSGVRCEPEALGEHGGAGCCFETRSWPTGYRGRLALHAGARFDVGRTHIDPAAEPLFVRSAIVGTCELVGCVPIGFGSALWPSATRHGAIVVSLDGTRAMYYRPSITSGEHGVDVSRQLPFGRFVTGNFAWLLAGVERCEPIPARGRQGLWEWRATSTVDE